MTVQDAQQLGRTAQRLVVEYRRGYGSPPQYDLSWQPLWGAKVDRIEINHGARPSTARVWFPALRWHQSGGPIWGDMIRIRTDEPQAGQRTILFVGFITNYLSEFSGGTERPGTAFERNAVVCMDHRWVLSVTSPIFGQIARGPDDYYNYGTPTQKAIDSSSTWLMGRRAIFNADGRPNRDPVLLKMGADYGDLPVFCNPSSSGAEPWTAGQMLRYTLCLLWNKAYRYLPIPDPSQLVGLDHPDWEKVINHIVIDGLNALDAVQHICRHLGWSFREDYYNDGDVRLAFYKIAGATGYTRSDSSPTILHRLHAPAVGEELAVTVGEGRKMLWAMSLAEDIGGVINNPWGLGAPDRFEFTAELVPAWRDDTLIPDTSEDNANLFFTEAELQDMEDKEAKPFYSFYHIRGAVFNQGSDIRNVGRRWVLNESGRYSAAPYDRGTPFDFSEVVPPEYIIGASGRRLFAPFNRKLLPCLTLAKDSVNSVGIRVEFSFDAGETWQVIPASIGLLDDQCGIYIEEANLAEMVDAGEGAIDGGELDGLQLNYWTSLCDDKLNGRVFKYNYWRTRVRITASVQMDQRLAFQAKPTPASGSPFDHSQIYDFSEKYGLAKRTSSSVFGDTPLSSHDVDSTLPFVAHLDALRDANQDMSVSGQFTLERLWLRDGAGVPDFAVGDCIEKVTGRDYNLAVSFGGGVVYPEIIQIIYLPDRQKMKLITRDLRFAEVTL